jgi:hypothetical protein
VKQKPIKSDLARLDRMTDAGINYSDIPPLGKAFFRKATVPWPPAKKYEANGLGRSKMKVKRVLA